MTALPYAQVDVFADRPFTGNPAAIVRLDDWLPDAVLQAIAAETGLGATAFAKLDHRDADYELRWFTPLREIALCGHATLAAGHLLLSGDRLRFRTRKAGILDVWRDGDAYALSLPAWTPARRPLPEIVAALGVEPVETLWRDGRYAVAVLASEADVRSAKPDFASLAAIGDVQAIITAPGSDTDIVSRVFIPGAGIDEDLVTGSAHAVIVPYWAERLGRTEFSAYQASRRGGRLSCRLEGDRVIIGGRCVTVIEGELRV